MRFHTIIPTPALRPYIKQFVISENAVAAGYKVFPSTSVVMGFQYSGQLAAITNGQSTPLATAGITGMSDHVKVFSSTNHTATLLVYFTEQGFAHFTRLPVHELFNASVPLEQIFDKYIIAATEEKLCVASTDGQRIQVIEKFFLSQLKTIAQDALVVAAVKLIYQSKGAIPVSELVQKLFISQSAFEKRFRKLVGASAKKFASVVRFNSILNDMESGKTLSQVCYDNNFFDQAHFIKTFKQYTGDTPETFKRSL